METATSMSTDDKRQSEADDDPEEDDGEWEEFEAPVPPDGGWGWIVLISSFFSNVVIDGVCLTYSVFFNELRDYFGASQSKTALVGALVPACFSLVGTPTNSNTHPLVRVPNWGLSSNRGHYQPGSVPDWWVCIQTNVSVGRCLQTHTHTHTHTKLAIRVHLPQNLSQMSEHKTDKFRPRPRPQLQDQDQDQDRNSTAKIRRLHRRIANNPLYEVIESRKYPVILITVARMYSLQSD